MFRSLFRISLSIALLSWRTAAADGLLESRAAPTIPDYVMKYAPLVHLDINELYFPSDIGAQIPNTQAELNFTPVAEPRDTDLTNLATNLNRLGNNCSVDRFDSCNLYLTSKTILGNVSTDPTWLHGVVPDADGATNGAISCAVIVNDHGNGLVDAFYFYFYAFNLGNAIPQLQNRIAGNHVGDWEHTMTRFRNGLPQNVWYSQHAFGTTYSWDSLTKDGTRHIVFSASGGHGNYPEPGIHSRNETIIILNDTTSAGPLWDPLKSTYFYTYTPTSKVNGTFQAASPSPDAPVNWLYFLGLWGDKQYNESNPVQFNFFNLEHTWDDGPTGPLDKDLNRTETCPDRVSPCPTVTAPAPSGSTSFPLTISRTKTATVASTTSESPIMFTGAGTSGSGVGTGAASASASADSSQRVASPSPKAVSTNAAYPSAVPTGSLIAIAAGLLWV